MRIGIDLDDVLAEFQVGFLKWHNREYDTNKLYEDITVTNYGMVFKQPREEMIKRVLNYYQTPEFKEIEPAKRSKEVVEELHNNDHKLYIVTARPEEISHITEEWLHKHYGDIFEDIVSTNLVGFDKKKMTSKGEVCKRHKIEVIIEDQERYVEDLVNKGIKTYILDKPWNQSAIEHPLAKRIYSWDEFKKEIIND